MPLVSIAWLALVLGCGTDGGPPKGKDKATDSGTTSVGPTAGTGSGTGTGTGSGTGGTTASEWLEVGDGVDAHRALAQGAEVLVIFGIQGGWHLDVSAEVHGLGNVIGVDIRTVRVRDEAEVGDNSQRSFLQLGGYDEDARVGWFAGERSVFRLTPGEICDLEGEELDLCVTAEDLVEPGRIAEGCARVVARLGYPDTDRCAATGTGSGTGTGTGAP